MRSRITLITTGRRTGQLRAATLYAFSDGDRNGDRLVVVGSQGGATRDPAWCGNLRAHPRATVRRGNEEWPVVAREAAGEERVRLWELVTTESPFYGGFQRRTKRVIPIFVLVDSRKPRPPPPRPNPRPILPRP